jgi:hypothetical protein
MSVTPQDLTLKLLLLPGHKKTRDRLVSLQLATSFDVFRLTLHTVAAFVSFVNSRSQFLESSFQDLLEIIRPPSHLSLTAVSSELKQSSNCILTHMSIARQRLDKQIPEVTLLTIEGCALLGNGPINKHC